MPRIIQTFSDLSGIDTRGQLKTVLRIQRHGQTRSRILINSLEINQDYTVCFWDLMSSVRLSIELEDFDEGTSGIEITEFSINGLEILPKYQHLANRSTNYIDQLGTYELVVPANFYTWYHGISGQGFIA